MKNKIWIDDLRPAPAGYQWCRNYEQAVAALNTFSSCGEGIEIVDLDHDLGEEKTGYDIAKYIVMNNIIIDSFRCHSMNVVGKKNIIQLLINYRYKNID